MTQPTRGIVTPEAVLLEFQTASVPTRVLQFSLDVLVQFAGFVAAFLVLGAADAANLAIPEWVAIVFATVMFFLILLGYPILMETLWNGRTLGASDLGVHTIEGQAWLADFDLEIHDVVGARLTEAGTLVLAGDANSCVLSARGRSATTSPPGISGLPSSTARISPTSSWSPRLRNTR